MRGTLLAGLALAATLAGCGGGSGQAGCLTDEGARCWEGWRYEGSEAQANCAAEGGQFAADGCPATELCLGVCNVEGTPVYFYYPGFASAAEAEAYCGTNFTWSLGCGGPSPPSFLTTPCATLGGVTLPGGACYLACEARADCPFPPLECGNEYNRACKLGGCSADTDCGATGWICSYGGCYMACQTETPGEESPECPEGWTCSGDTLGQPACWVLEQTPTCGEPCPQGCCSPSGLTCCQPPFCDGSCAGSSCC
ncbi:MAG TPA: hypothetical protein PK668_21570 [Myxococcota bacterium]|nr:hypothetical protein [Myxococcota bacterium]HRY96068.1 hypothetical protein [Myxococcota bacterium]